jgi:hypothetical protein
MDVLSVPKNSKVLEEIELAALSASQFCFNWNVFFEIQHCFICHPSDSTVSEDAGIEFRTVATLALAVRRCEIITGEACNTGHWHQ